MAFDPSIISQIPDYSVNPVAAQGNALTLANAAQGYQSGQIDLQEKRQQQQDEAQARALLKGVDLNTPEGQQKLQQLPPEMRMKMMAGVARTQQAASELTLSQLQAHEAQSDALSGALDPIVAQLDQERQRLIAAHPKIAQLTEQDSAMLDAKAKQLAIPAALQLRQQRPDLAQYIDRFLQDPQGLTYQGIRSADEQSKRGNQAIKDRIAQQRLEDQEKQQERLYQLAMRKETQKEGEGGPALSPEAQRLKDDLAARDPSFMASRSGAKSIAQQNKLYEDWAKQGRTADDIIGSRQETKGTTAEVSALYKQKAGLARTEKSIVSSGGFLDQAEQAVREVDLGKVKNLGKLNNWRLDQITDPALQNYYSRITELRAEYAIVLSKGGVVTNEARNEAEKVIPDYMTPESFARIKQAVQQGISASTRGVDDSIAEATKRGSGPAAAGWGKATVVGQ